MAMSETLRDSGTIDAALEPNEPGLLVRSLGSVLPGLAKTRDQIVSHNAYWRKQAEFAIDGVEPLLIGLGDSLTQGIGCADPADSYLNQLAIELGYEGRIVNLSRSGARIDDVFKVQLPALEQLAHRAALVVCTVGSNDLMRSSRVAALHNKFDQLADHFACLDATTKLATLPANGSMSAKFVNRHLRALADDNRVELADVANHIETWRGRTASDGFHPNELGYEAWTAAFLDALDS